MIMQNDFHALGHFELLVFAQPANQEALFSGILPFKFLKRVC